MQYDNKSEVEIRRMVVKYAAVVLLILLVIPIVGNFPILLGIWMPMLLLLLTLSMFAIFGGLDILFINIGNDYVEIMSSKYVSLCKHRKMLLSTETSNIVGYSYQKKMLFFRKFVIKYCDPENENRKECRVILWLTMINKRKRHELCNTMRNIILQNKQQ